MRLLLLLAFLSLPALAYTPEELLEGRALTSIKCDEATEECKISGADLAFLMQQNELLGKLSERLVVRLKACGAGRST